jgi:hypothetical protein
MVIVPHFTNLAKYFRCPRTLGLNIALMQRNHKVE